MAAEKGAVVRASDDKHIPEAFEGKLEPNYYCRGWNPRRSKYCSARSGQWTNHVGSGRCAFHGGNTEITTGRYSTIAHERLRDLVEYFENDPDPLNIESEIALLRALTQDYVERYGEMSEALLAWHRSFEAQQLEAPEERIMAFERVIEEYEILMREGGYEPSAKQLAELQDARKFMDSIRGRNAVADAQRPRKILDITAAHALIDSLTKAVERIEKARAINAISRKDFFRLSEQMGKAVIRRLLQLEGTLSNASPEVPVDVAKALQETLRQIRADWLDLAVS